MQHWFSVIQNKCVGNMQYPWKREVVSWFIIMRPNSILQINQKCKGYKPKTVHSMRERTDWDCRAEINPFSHRIQNLRLIAYLKHYFLCWLCIMSGNLFKTIVPYYPLSLYKPVLRGWFFCSLIGEFAVNFQGL